MARSGSILLDLRFIHEGLIELLESVRVGFGSCQLSVDCLSLKWAIIRHLTFEKGTQKHGFPVFHPVCMLPIEVPSITLARMTHLEKALTIMSVLVCRMSQTPYYAFPNVLVNAISMQSSLLMRSGEMRAQSFHNQRSTRHQSELFQSRPKIHRIEDFLWVVLSEAGDFHTGLLCHSCSNFEKSSIDRKRLLDASRGSL